MVDEKNVELRCQWHMENSNVVEPEQLVVAVAQEVVVGEFVLAEAVVV